MFWDKISGLYDLFENVYNGKVYKGTGTAVTGYITETDDVLECACGTGAISLPMAEKCHKLIATDFSKEMLKQAQKKCASLSNITFEEADITQLRFEDESFDKVVAGNVIHLLPNPQQAVKELERVTKKGGKIIIPTYINSTKNSGKLAVKFIEMLGAKFDRQFDLESYKIFFENLGYINIEYQVVDGKMPCAIAVIEK